MCIRDRLKRQRIPGELHDVRQVDPVEALAAGHPLERRACQIGAVLVGRRHCLESPLDVSIHCTPRYTSTVIRGLSATYDASHEQVSMFQLAESEAPPLTIGCQRLIHPPSSASTSSIAARPKASSSDTRTPLQSAGMDGAARGTRVSRTMNVSTTALRR